MIVSGFRAALDLDTYLLSKLIRPLCAEWAKSLALSLIFTPYLSNAVVSAKSPHYFHALAALKLLISLISRPVACSPRIVVDKQTDRHTDQVL